MSTDDSTEKEKLLLRKLDLLRKLGELKIYSDIDIPNFSLKSDYNEMLLFYNDTSEALKKKRNLEWLNQVHSSILDSYFVMKLGGYDIREQLINIDGAPVVNNDFALLKCFMGNNAKEQMITMFDGIITVVDSIEKRLNEKVTNKETVLESNEFKNFIEICEKTNRINKDDPEGCNIS